MEVLIFYDIIDNKIRDRLVKLLLESSFVRVQYSVFLGYVNKPRKLNHLIQEIISFIDLNEDSVYCFPVCEKDFENFDFLGKIINKRFHKDAFLIF